MYKHKCLIILLVLICGAFAADLTLSFKLCKRSLPPNEFNECLKDAIQDALVKLKDGLPEFNLPRLHPLEIPRITIGEGKGALHVVQNYTDVKVFNIPLAKVEKVDAKYNTTGMSISIDVASEDISVGADYDFDGKVLLLPLVGNGKSKIKFLNIKMRVELLGDIKEKRGNHYIKLKSAAVNIIPSKIDFHFDNLFNGDERLGNEILKVFNDNWKELWDDVKDQYLYALGVIMQDYANKVFKLTPFETLFPVD